MFLIFSFYWKDLARCSRCHSGPLFELISYPTLSALRSCNCILSLRFSNDRLFDFLSENSRQLCFLYCVKHFKGHFVSKNFEVDGTLQHDACSIGFHHANVFKIIQYLPGTGVNLVCSQVHVFQNALCLCSGISWSFLITFPDYSIV